MSILVIEFNEISVDVSGIWAVPAAPAISVGILLVPVFDTLRVFATRIFRNKAPFNPIKHIFTTTCLNWIFAYPGHFDTGSRHPSFHRSFMVPEKPYCVQPGGYPPGFGGRVFLPSQSYWFQGKRGMQ